MKFVMPQGDCFQWFMVKTLSIKFVRRTGRFVSREKQPRSWEREEKKAMEEEESGRG